MLYNALRHSPVQQSTMPESCPNRKAFLTFSSSLLCATTSKMLSHSPRRPPNSHWRLVYGDGELRHSTQGRDFLRKRQAWRASSSQPDDEGAKTYKWRGRRITLITSHQSRGSAVNAVRELSSSKVVSNNSAAVLSPLRVTEKDEEEGTDGPPTTVSATSSVPPPPPTPKKLSPIKTNLIVVNGSGSNGLVYVNKPIRLKLDPGTAAVELQPSNGVMVVTSIMEDPPKVKKDEPLDEKDKRPKEESPKVEPPPSYEEEPPPQYNEEVRTNVFATNSGSVI